MKLPHNLRIILSFSAFILLFVFYPPGYERIGIQANSIAVIPIIMFALINGMKLGAIFGLSASIYMTAIRLLMHDPGLNITNAFILALIAGFGGGIFGMLSDQRVALKDSEKKLSKKVAEQTIEMQKLLNELELAYETTLEGWSRALELRDRETEGHSQRVPEISVAIGRLMGLDENAVRYIYYGALLHDIGKMGIPDEILHKQGPLTPEERAIVNQHPNFAYKLLKDINYLQPAIAIPYSHHENWDGTGYPQGLKGEEIPISARIFSVVDNWDALTYDRPYRKAWSREKTIQYIREQSGKMFDPKIVDLFFEYLDATR